MQLQPPCNIEAEKALLSTVLTDPTAINHAAEILAPTDFYLKNHQLIFKGMLDLADRGEPIDPVTLQAALNRRIPVSEIETIYTFPHSGHAKAYTDLIKEASTLRRLAQAGRQIETQARAGGHSAEALEAAQQAIFSISEDDQRGGFVQIRDLVKSGFDLLQKLYKQKTSITGVATGYHDLDQLTAGLQPGDLVILAGRPSMGKTALALNIAEFAGGQGRGAGIFSLEMTKEQLYNRLWASISRVDSRKLRTGQVDAADFPKLTEGAGRLSQYPIFIDDTATTLTEIRAKARRLKIEKNIGLLVIDYLQLIDGNGENRQQEVSEISRSLKRLAKELDIPIIALSQLNRGLENRPDKRPIMADLRDSGGIEQDADVIMFVYREAIYCEDCKAQKPCSKDHTTAAEIILGKQRNGPTGTVNLVFKGELTRFENAAKNKY